MRVTNGMNNQNILNSINKNQAKLSNLQIQMASEQKINFLSDAPESAARILNADVSLNKIENYLNNIKSMTGELKTSESVLTQVGTAINRILELTTSASNGTNNAQTLQAINDELKQIKDQIITLANTEYNGNYIYSGTKTGLIPFSVSDDGSVNYNGTPAADDYKRSFHISDNVKESINLNGEEVFGYSVYNPETEKYDGYGIVDVLNNIINDIDKQPVNYDNIRSHLDDIKVCQEAVVSFRTKLGALQNRLEMATEQHENSKITLDSLKEDLQTVDLADIITRISQQQTALQASMYASSAMTKISMLDYI